MTYANAIQYLASLRPEAGISKKTLGLAPIRALLAELGNPQDAFPAVHVGGTAGKGTTATMIASILRAAGYRVGLTLSPHLETPRERIQINGKMIGEKEFGTLIEQVARASRKRKKKVSYFESLIAAAFLCFARKKIDIAVVEVGLGGRLDATNVVRPELSVITNVDLDHTEVLGHTIAKIAKEKADIIKPGVPVLTATKRPDALWVIRAVARARGSPFARVPLPRRPSPSRGRERVGGSSADDPYRPALIGLGAAEDARLAIAAVKILRGRGRKISDHAIRVGLKTAFIPGRMEMVSHRPLVILDGAHNPLKVRTLVKSLQAMFPHKQFTVVVAINHTKPYRTLLRLLKPIAARFVCTEFGSANSHQSFPAALLAKATGRIPATVIRDPCRAVRTIVDNAKSGDAIIITGSLYLLGAVRTTIKKRRILGARGYHSRKRKLRMRIGHGSRAGGSRLSLNCMSNARGVMA